MGTTPTWALPYPEPTDPVAGGADAIKALATRLDTELNFQIFASAAERDAQWPNPPVGALCVTLDSQLLYKRGASAWGGLDVESVAGWTGGAWGRVTAGGLVCSGTARLAGNGGGNVAVDVSTYVAIAGPPGAAGTSLAVDGYPADGSWTSKVLRLTAGNPSAGQCGIAFHTAVYSDVIQIQSLKPGGTGVHGFHFVNIANSGYVPLTASAFLVGSAARFKENVTTWEGDATAVVDQLRPISYTLKPSPLVEDDPEPDVRFVGTPPTQLGLLAEDVAEVLPDAVAVDDEGPLSIDLGAMVAVLVSAVQELTARVAQLEGAAS